MSDINNNIPTRITQLEEATEYEDGMFYAVAKAGRGTYKIPVDEMTPNEQALSDKIENEIVPAVENSFAYGMVDESEIASFQDGSELPLKVLEIAVEPQQDLHGYDYPWVGGSGKNKLPMTIEGIKAANTDGTWSGNIYTINDGTFTILTDSGNNVTGIKANGIFNATSLLKLGTMPVSSATQFICNGCPNGGSTTTFSIQVLSGPEVTDVDNGSGVTFTASADKSARIVIRSGYNASNLIFYPMIRLASVTDATFAPYSNECLISGWTECKPTVCGKNLFDVNNITVTTNKLIDTEGAEIANDYWGTSSYYEIKPNTTYGLQARSDNAYTMYVAEYDINKNFIQRRGVGGSGSGSLMKGSFTTSAECRFIRICLPKNGSSSTAQFNTVQLELGDTASDFEEYNGSTITIQLGDTYYWCKIDVVSGLLTVFGTLPDLPNLSWGKSTNTANIYFYVLYTSGANGTYNEPATNVMSNIYTPKSRNTVTNTQGTVGISAEVNALYIADGRFDNYTVDQFKEAMSDVQLLLPLATPIEVQLSPTQVKSLKGYNNISADTGNILKVEYIRDLDIVINSLLERIAALEG